MSFTSLLTEHLGVVPRSLLRAQGASDHRIRGWLDTGILIRIGRRFVALPRARPEALRAARLGARIACVSAAQLRGIWVVDDGRLHLTVRTNHSHVDVDGMVPPVRLHWTSHPLDPLGDRTVLESGHNMLAHLANCQPLDLAVAAFDSAIRKGMITIEELRGLAAVRRGRFARVVALCSELADSGLESLTRVRLLLEGVLCREQIVIDGHPVDLLIGSWLIIQLDGSQHASDSAQHARDLNQDRRLRLMGYTVFRYRYAAVVHDWARTRQEIGAAMALGLHLAPSRAAVNGG